MPRKQMPLFFILLFAFTLSACSSTGQIEKNRLTDSITPADQTVSVLRGTITPTVSAQMTIVPAVPFIISSPENGILNTGMKAEEKIAAGQVIGTVNGKELKSPIDGTIISIAPSGESVPGNYPVATIHYTGFALNVEAENFLSTLPVHADMKAKFQVYDGVGPTEAIDVAEPAADGNTLAGIVPQDGISVLDLKDRELSMLRANNIGFVFQNYSLIKHLRVWENIELPLLYAKKALTKKQRHEMITDLLKSVGLENKGDDYPINLSGGEQQRVAIARALSVSPEAILCDEPTGALDKRTGTQIMELLHSVVKENGIMLLLVTHDPDIADTCDTIFEMDGGRITYAENDT